MLRLLHLAINELHAELNAAIHYTREGEKKMLYPLNTKSLLFLRLN